jgi:hypothetical protein
LRHLAAKVGDLTSAEGFSDVEVSPEERGGDSTGCMSFFQVCEHGRVKVTSPRILPA